MKPGQIIELPDGRRATVVMHWLTGYGVIWDERPLSDDDIEALRNCSEARSELEPEAMLRKPELSERLGVECVGEDYKIIEEDE